MKNPALRKKLENINSQVSNKKNGFNTSAYLSSGHNPALSPNANYSDAENKKKTSKIKMKNNNKAAGIFPFLTNPQINKKAPLMSIVNFNAPKSKIIHTNI